MSQGALLGKLLRTPDSEPRPLRVVFAAGWLAVGFIVFLNIGVGYLNRG
jgi:hypothetical protein